MNEITIYDIAEKAGVSASTVSRVINNYPHVKKETRNKVLKILSENKFVPNETARSLVNQSTKMVGILIADLRTTHHTDGVYYVEHEFSKKGYSCLIYNTGMEPEKVVPYIQLLSQRKIDAVVMMGSVYQNEVIATAIKNYLPSIPIVICNGYLEEPNVYGVVSNEKEGVSDCVKLLSNRGRKNPAFVYNRITPSNQDKIDGFKLGCNLYMEGKSIVVDGGETIESVMEATKSLVSEHPEIDAIVYSEDYIAMIGMHALYKIGKKIPEDLAVIGINNSRQGKITNPSLTTLDNMLYDTSLMAVRNIIHVLEGEKVAKKVVICTKVIEREST